MPVIIFQVAWEYFCDAVFYCVNCFRLKTVFMDSQLVFKIPLLKQCISLLVLSYHKNSNVNLFSLIFLKYSLFTIGMFSSYKNPFTSQPIHTNPQDAQKDVCYREAIPLHSTEDESLFPSCLFIMFMFMLFLALYACSV